MLRLHSRTYSAQRALHFTISPVIARSYVYVYVRTKIRTYTCDGGFHTAEDEIHPVYAPHIRGEYILRRGPPTHYLRSLLMARHDPPRRTPHIFLPVTFILRILINRDLGHRCASTYVCPSPPHPSPVSCWCVHNKRDIRSRFIKQHDATNVIQLT